MPAWNELPPPPSPFGQAFIDEGLHADPNWTPPPSPEAMTDAGIKQLQTSSTPIRLAGNYPMPAVPGQPIPMPAPGGELPAPLPEPSLLRGGPGGGGPVSRAMGFGLRLPPTSDEVAEGMAGSRPYAPNPGNVGKPNESLGDLSMKYMNSANIEQAIAKRAEADIADEGLRKLADVSGKRAKIYEGAEGTEKTANEETDKQLAETNANIKADTEYVRTHSRIDPYRTFKTNAGAGILALLGTALMAGGAAIGRDTSLKWTQQIDKLLDREAEEQMRLLQNKKWSITEAGQNMKRIAQTSVDQYEARARFRMQGLQALNERAEQIKNTTESKAVHARAEQFIAENTRKLGEEMGNIAMRREALRSGESVAELQARVASRGQDVGLYGQLYGDATRLTAAQRAAEKEQWRPIRDQINELRKNYSSARAAAQRYYEALVAGKKSEQLNELAGVFGDAYSKYASGTPQNPAARQAMASYGFTVNPKELVAKFNNQKSAKDMADMIKNLDRSQREQESYISEQAEQWPTAAPPTGAVYRAQ